MRINKIQIAALLTAAVVASQADAFRFSARSTPADALPCRFSFPPDNFQGRHTADARIAFPVRISGEGLEPCLKLSVEKPDGTKQFVAASTLGKTQNVALFFITSFYNEHARDTNLSFFVEQVPGPCVTVQADSGRAVSLMVNPEEHPRLDPAEALTPLWTTNRIVNETVLPVSVNGEPAEGRLLFAPEGAAVVRNYALDKTYEAGTDYILDGNILRLPAGSSIPSMTQEQLYPAAADAPPGTLPSWKGGYVAFANEGFWNPLQTVVSYVRSSAWDDPAPSSAPGRLLRTKAKLQAGQPLKIVMLGDSIAFGYGASGVVDKPPYLPAWGNLLADRLHRKFGSGISFMNASLGGTVSGWGKQVAPFFAAPEKPDLCIVAFGMNDGGGTSAEQYLANTQAIIESVRAKKPDTEFILVASWMPNENWRPLKPMDGYLAALKTLESPQIAVADIWSVSEYILKTKRYCDITSNHVNHPNDFMVRIYEQVVGALLDGE